MPLKSWIAATCTKHSFPIFCRLRMIWRRREILSKINPRRWSCSPSCKSLPLCLVPSLMVGMMSGTKEVFMMTVFHCRAVPVKITWEREILLIFRPLPLGKTLLNQSSLKNNSVFVTFPHRKQIGSGVLDNFYWKSSQHVSVIIILSWDKQTGL